MSNIQTKFSLLISHIVLYGLMAMLFAFLLLDNQVATAGGWGYLKPTYMFLWASLTLGTVGVVLATIMNLIRPQSSALPAVTGALMALYLLFDYYFFSLNGQHLDLEGVVLTVNGWLSGEIGNPWVIPGAVGLLGAISWALLYGLDVGLRKFTKNCALHSPVALAICVFIVAGAWVYGAYQTKNDVRLSELAEPLPWTPLLGLNKQKIPRDLQLFTQPAPLTIDTEIAALSQAELDFATAPATINAVHQPNILLILVEGWRFDRLSAENTPRLWARLAQGEFEQLKHHYSSGNTTPSSLFGALSGMNGFFYQAALATGASSYALKILQKLGYDMTAWEIDGLTYNDLFKDQFAPSGMKLEAMLQGNEARYVKDSTILHKLTQTLTDPQRDSTPRFDFFLYYSTHFDYYYPPEFEKFTPVGSFGEMSSGASANLRKSRDLIFNRYRNSILYMDYLLDSALHKLQESGYLDSAIVIIAGDHGEEFWENGVFGHTYRLDDWQTRTSCLVRFPGGLNTAYTTTSHVDFFPTILDYMQVDFGWQNFVTGKSLWHFDPAQDHAVVIKGGKKGFLAYRAAVADTGYKVLFQNRYDQNKALEEILYRDQPTTQIDLPRVQDLMNRVLGEKRLGP